MSSYMYVLQYSYEAKLHFIFMQLCQQTQESVPNVVFVEYI